MPAPVITQNLAVYIHGTAPLPRLSAVGAAGQIAWSAPWGTFSRNTTNNSQTTDYSPVNQSDSIIVTARDISDNAISTTVLKIEAKFPYQGNYRNVPRSLDQITNESIAEDGGESFTEKGDPNATFIWKFLARQQSEHAAVDAFWRWHRKTKSFWLLDVARNDIGDPTIGELIRVRFAAPFQDNPFGADFMDYDLTFKQAVRP